MRLAAPDGIFVELNLLIANRAINHGRQLAIPDGQSFVVPGFDVAQCARRSEPNGHRSRISVQRRHKPGQQRNYDANRSMRHGAKMQNKPLYRKETIAKLPNYLRLIIRRVKALNYAAGHPA